MKNKIYSFIKIIILLILISLTYGCGTTHYEKVRPVQKAMINRNYEKADEILSGTKVDPLLHALDKAMIAHLAGNYGESNRHFEKAISRIDELYRKNLAKEAATYVTNDKVQPYRGEDFESVLLHYYMALNYLMMGDLEEALVECRRVNIKLLEINDKYEHKNVYKSDAFVHYLMGTIYEADGDLNNAFIAYRNAYETYDEDYKKYYGLSAPTQLKKDLLRTTEALGFNQEFRQYKNKFGDLDYQKQEKYRENGELIFIWDNGLAPIKEEETFTMRLEDEDKDDYIKMAFPIFRARPPSVQYAQIKVGNYAKKTDLFEDVAGIAMKNLEDRRVRTMLKAAARTGIKYGIQKTVEKEYGETAGFLVNLLNVATEQADTRSWITLPDNIQIVRILYAPGIYDIKLEFIGSGGRVVDSKIFYDVKMTAGKKSFLLYRTFE